MASIELSKNKKIVLGTWIFMGLFMKAFCLSQAFLSLFFVFFPGYW